MMAPEKAEHQKETVITIDKDKGSQYALKWAVDHLLQNGQTITLLHIHQKPFGSQGAMPQESPKALAAAFRETFLPFRCFCTRKDIKCNEVVVNETDVAKGIIDYVTANNIEVLVMGSPKGGLVRRFKASDLPSSVTKGAPQFCTVYTVNKGKVQSVQHASASVPPKPSIQCSPHAPLSVSVDVKITSPFNRNKGGSPATKYEPSVSESDLSFISSGRPSTERHYPSFYDFSDTASSQLSSTSEQEIRSFASLYSGGRSIDTMNPQCDYSICSQDSSGRMSVSLSNMVRKNDISDTVSSRLSSSSEQEIRSFASLYSGGRSIDMMNLQHDYSICSQDSNGRMSVSSSNMDEVEAEMRRLRLELKQTMDMYSSACKEARTAKQTAMELHQSKLEEHQKLEDARLAGEVALALVEKEKAKCKAAVEAAEAAQRIAELEAQKRRNAEMKVLKEAEKNRALQSMAHTELRYRKYTIEEIEAATKDFSSSLKIGEGGYGPVFKGYLDHTPVAIKVLRPDAAQGQSQFQQEVEVLSCIRHPYMVLLLGACPEYGCLVYEYMANGSLDDRLFRRGNTPPLSWQLRFRIAAEIATALLFLHQAKPEPIVHRDLKPGNILLDRNYVSRISDVGLARLVPPSVADTVTQYRMTSMAGTFCYIDPEYQQTGLLGTKSDIYSLGIMLLQIITAKPPMGLSHHVEKAIEKGTFADMLDPAVPDWPVPQALKFAKLALQCAELRRRDRPDLDKVILPELERLRAVAEENLPSLLTGGTMSSPDHSQGSIYPEFISDEHSGYESAKSRSSTSSNGVMR